MAEELAQIRRGFVDIAEGQVHYRTAGIEDGDAPPLVMFHTSYFSSKTLEPLVARLGRDRRVVALDTLGHGDSCPPIGNSPTLEQFVDAHMRAIDTMGFSGFDLYGNHGGSRLAMEIAITRNERVRRLILDGTSLLEASLVDIYESGDRPFTPDQDGSHIMRLWHCARDTSLFFPWDQRGPENRRPLGLPDADTLHDLFLELAKGARTWHLFHLAAVGYPNRERLPQIGVPTLVSCAEHDRLRPYLDDVAGLVPGARKAALPSREIDAGDAGYDEAARVFAAFLDEDT